MNTNIKPGFEFRIAKTEDSDMVCELVNSVYRGDNAKKGWTTESDLLDGIRINTDKVNAIIKADKSVILLLLSEGKIIGCVNLEKKGNKCHLGMLSVNVNYQKGGIGKLLMDKSEEYAMEDFKCDEMEMKVIGQRTELIEYYQRRGYVKTGESEPFVLNTHFGKPKVEGLYFEYLVKPLKK